MSGVIYLDHNATTPVDPAVLESMLPFLREHYGNPSSGHAAGKVAREAIEQARAEVAALLGGAADEVVFTSGATEALNAAIFSAVATQPDRPMVMVSAVEHSAVVKAAEYAVGSGNVRRLRVTRDGRYDLGHLEEVLREGKDRLALACLMWANNETGIIGGVREAAEILERHGVPLLCDMVQAIGKEPVDVALPAMRFAALSGHKFHAPKGVGALWIRSGTPFSPHLHGGGQEGGRRGGTENTAYIAGLGTAAKLARLRAASPSELERWSTARARFENSLAAELPDVTIHGAAAPRVPNTTCVHLGGVPAEAMLVLLDEAGLCASSGSACRTGQAKPSPVLLAMGVGEAAAAETLRFSSCPSTTPDELDQAAAIIVAAAKRVRERLGGTSRRGRVVRRSTA